MQLAATRPKQQAARVEIPKGSERIGVGKRGTVAITSRPKGQATLRRTGLGTVVSRDHPNSGTTSCRDFHPGSGPGQAGELGQLNGDPRLRALRTGCRVTGRRAGSRALDHSLGRRRPWGEPLVGLERSKFAAGASSRKARCTCSSCYHVSMLVGVHARCGSGVRFPSPTF